MPYLEWRHSDYRDRESCQSCHMPLVEGKMPISSVLPQARDGLSRHVFRGANFFMPRMLDRHREVLGVDATSSALQAAARRSEAHLREQTARVDLRRAVAQDGQLVAVVEITNLAGHKLPTAYPSRRAWLHLKVVDAIGATLFESGAFRPDGSIAGNDNDQDATRYEPHHRVITSPDQVQVYEAIMAEPDGSVTTGLLSATRFVKDNRILPRGFDKTTAGPDIADASFQGGSDRITYRVDLGGKPGPYRVVAELWYQPIAYRWAMNLEPFDAAETERFVRWYQAMAPESAMVVADDKAMTR